MHITKAHFIKRINITGAVLSEFTEDRGKFIVHSGLSTRNGLVNEAADFSSAIGEFREKIRQ
jgi:hypothetical protein